MMSILLQRFQFRLHCCSFLFLLCIRSIEAFDVLRRPTSSPSASTQSSSLSYRVEEPFKNLAVAEPKLMPPNPLTYFSDIQDQRRRDKLKKELAVAAIENYDMEAYTAGMTNIAEDIMKQLEQVNPWEFPAYHPELNARWSFVFTGVPTIGMRLITLLSRLSVGFDSIIDFRDVFLEVSNENTQVKAIVAVEIMGIPIELNVYTRLEPKLSDNRKRTFLVETFEKLVLSGIEIPTPESWKSSRDLEITYLDQDMMIARTAGGEPHLLLRHSPCSTDDETCDIDMEVTEYFEEARSKYGSTLSRSLVDRAYDEASDNTELDVDNIAKLVKSILQGENGH